MSKLQRRELPTYQTVLPLSKIKVNYRPYTIKEERILDIAGSSEDSKDKFNAVKQVVQLCSDIEQIDEIPACDFDYMFIQLYKISDSGDVPFVYNNSNCTTDDCPNEINMTVNLDKHIKITEIDNQDEYSKPYSENEPHKRIIDLVDDYKLVLQNKIVDDLMINNVDDLNEIDISKIIYNILIGVIDKDDYLTKDNFSEEEFKEFFESFKPNELNKLKEYISHLPSLIAENVIICPKCKTKHQLKLTGLLSFLI